MNKSKVAIKRRDYRTCRSILLSQKLIKNILLNNFNSFKKLTTRFRHLIDFTYSEMIQTN